MIELDGGRLESAWWGGDAGDAPSLVLLHEGLGSVALWREFPQALAEKTGCGVFAWSRFGYGGSDPAPLPWPIDYMQREALRNVPRVLDATGVTRCILIGHSDGASIATIYAGSRQDFRVRGLVLLAPHFFVETVTRDSIARIHAEYETSGLRTRLARYHADPDIPFHGWSGAWLDPRFAAAFDLADELAQIRVPILILQGSRDPYGTEAQARMAETRCTSPVRTVMVDAGHAPHLDAREAVLDVIAGFVDRIFRVHEHAC
ncbi:MAG: alpha/beta fold hydrolase [Acetobacteraceae bacterium]